MLRRQLVVLRCMVHKRVRLTNSDRLFFIQLYRWFPSVLKVITIIHPETLVRWHRAGFRRYWRWKSRLLGGRLLYALSYITRIAAQRSGLDQRHSKPDGRMDCASDTEAFPWNDAPRYLIRDRDRVYGDIVMRRLRAMGIRDKPIAPGPPWQNGFAERLIGSIRRECVDHFIVLGEAHLRRILRAYARYYNNIRTHRSLDKDAPVSRPVQRIGSINSHAILGGLHHHYVRV